MSLLERLVATAHETVRSGYYDQNHGPKRAPSLVGAVESSRHRPAIVAEIKPATPIRGRLTEGDQSGRMAQFLREGACALSIVTEPEHFRGSLENLRDAVALGAPVLMKDIVVDERQIDCAASLGASAVLLIADALPQERLVDLIGHAHSRGREVLLECASRPQLQAALDTKADLVGVNNRDLSTFEVDVGRTLRFARGLAFDRPFVSLSGIESPADVERVRPLARALVVGTALLEGRTTVAQLVGA